MKNKPWVGVLFFALCLAGAATIIATRRGTNNDAKRLPSSQAASKSNDWNSFEDDTLTFQYPTSFKVQAHTNKPEKN